MAQNLYDASVITAITNDLVWSNGQDAAVAVDVLKGLHLDPIITAHIPRLVDSLIDALDSRTNAIRNFEADTPDAREYSRGNSETHALIVSLRDLTDRVNKEKITMLGHAAAVAVDPAAYAYPLLTADQRAALLPYASTYLISAAEK